MATMRSVPPPPARNQGGSKALLIAAAVIFLAAAAGGAAYWWATHRSPPARSQTQSRARAAATPGTLTNDDIIEMAAAKVAPSVIVSQIRTSKTSFNLSSGEVIRLSKAGVPAAVIEAMRNPGSEVTSSAQPPAPVTVPVALADGLPVRLTLAEDIPSDAVPGDLLRFTVARDVRVNGSLAIPAGAAAVGTIVDPAKKSIFGIGGRMTFRLEKVDAVDGQTVRIRATQNPRRDGSSKRPVNAGSRKSKAVASTAGTEYLAWVDGPAAVTVKKQR
jgi:hypothetical protein